MRKCILIAGALIGMLGWSAHSSAEGPRATIYTHSGASYTVADTVVEIAYTIGEIKESKDKGATEKFGPSIVLNTSASAGQPEQAKGEQEGKEPPLLRARREITDLPLKQADVEIRVPLNLIRTLRLSRAPAGGPPLPPYIPFYDYTASLVLVSGAELTADHVNWGTARFRGLSDAGPVLIPWQDIASITFER